MFHDFRNIRKSFLFVGFMVCSSMFHILGTYYAAKG